jgi:hypothetical protein
MAAVPQDASGQDPPRVKPDGPVEFAGRGIRKEHRRFKKFELASEAVDDVPEQRLPDPATSPRPGDLDPLRTTHHALGCVSAPQPTVTREPIPIGPDYRFRSSESGRCARLG